MFRKKQNASAALQTESLEALEQEIREFDLAAAPRSTIISANELYLLQKSGYEFLQIVFGNVVYSMGLRGLLRSVQRALQQGEMSVFTRMINDARVIARNRMLTQAKAVGATDVVGVIIEVREFADFLEVTATGTAVKKNGERGDLNVAVSA